MPERPVRRSPTLLSIAKSLFPPGGSAEGDPSFEVFEAGPLRAVEELFGRAFDEQPEAAPGIRIALTHPVPLFPPIAFFAVLITDGSVELVDLIVDEDYWDLVERDPSE